MAISDNVRQKDIDEALIRVCFSAISLALFAYVWQVRAYFSYSSFAFLVAFAALMIATALIAVISIWMASSFIIAHFARRGLMSSLHLNSSIFLPLLILMGYPMLVLPTLSRMGVIIGAFMVVVVIVNVMLLLTTPVLRHQLHDLWSLFKSYLIFLFRGRNFWWTFIVWIGALAVGLFLWSQTYPLEWRQFIFTNTLSKDAYSSLLRFAAFFIILGHSVWIFLGYIKKKAIACTDELCFISIAQSYIPLLLAFGFVIDFGFDHKVGDQLIAPIVFSILSGVAGGLAAYKVAPRILRSAAIGEKLTLSMILAVAISLFVAFTASVNIQRYLSFALNAKDIGVINQAIWNTANGRIFESSYYRNIYTLLGDHTSFIWLLFTPLYQLWSDPRVLIISQSLIIALGAIPVFLIANRLLNSRWSSLIMSGVYLLYFPLQNAGLSGINELAFAPVLLLAAFYSWMRDKTGWMLMWLILLLAVNEELALTVAAFGIFSMLFSRKKLLGFYIAVAGVAYFLIAIKIIIPHFSGSAYAYNLLPPYLGANIIEKSITFILNPIFIIKSFITPWPDKLISLFEVFGPMGFTPFLGGSVLLMMVPAAAIKWFSSDPQHWGTYSYYSAHLAPIIVIASCYAIRNMSEWRHSILLHRRNLWTSDKDRVVFALVWALLISTFLTCYFFGSIPISRSYSEPLLTLGAKSRLEAFDAVVSAIPPGAAVSAQDDLFSYLSQRRTVFVFPETRNAAYVVLDTQGSKYPMGEQEYGNQVKALLASGEYGLVEYKSGFAVLRTGFNKVRNQELLNDIK